MNSIEGSISLMTLILALIQVESGGDPRAIGDDGLAYGCLQMHESYVQDASEYAGQEWRHKDAFDSEKSVDIFLAYMARYANEKRLGHAPTARDIARIHNGGPNGYKKDSTLKYWSKVKAELEKRGFKLEQK